MPMSSEAATVKRVSLVRLRKDVDRGRCLDLWSGDHADVVRELPGVVGYTVDVAAGARPAGSWDALATLRFADADALRHFEADRDLQRRLLATREGFIDAVDAFLVDERTLIP
jgi:hypothetical protein